MFIPMLRFLTSCVDFFGDGKDDEERRRKIAE